MIVFSESTEHLRPSSSLRDMRASTEAAKLVGCRVYTIPTDFESCSTAENALDHVPAASERTPGLWIGLIPTPERYAAVYAAALAKNIRLVNSPAQFRTALEFDRSYRLLDGLTPTSLVITAVDQAAEAGSRLGFPVFVKGAIQSMKELGWEACVARNADQLARLADGLLGREARSGGRVVVRRLVHLRHARTSGHGFPLGREFRVFLYANRVLEYGYYWEGSDPLSRLTAAEENEVLGLAVLAAGRLGVPYVALDIGQLEGGAWIVIEPGDGQFAGLSQVSPLRLWNKLKDIGTE